MVLLVYFIYLFKHKFCPIRNQLNQKIHKYKTKKDKKKSISKYLHITVINLMSWPYMPRMHIENNKGYQNQLIWPAGYGKN